MCPDFQLHIPSYQLFSFMGHRIHVSSLASPDGTCCWLSHKGRLLSQDGTDVHPVCSSQTRQTLRGSLTSLSLLLPFCPIVLSFLPPNQTYKWPLPSSAQPLPQAHLPSSCWTSATASSRGTPAPGSPPAHSPHRSQKNTFKTLITSLPSLADLQGSHHGFRINWKPLLWVPQPGNRSPCPLLSFTSPQPSPPSVSQPSFRLPGSCSVPQSSIPLFPWLAPT